MGLKASSDSTLKLLARILINVAIAVFVIMAFLAYIETLWMKAEIKSEARELRKLRKETETLLKERNEKTVVPKPSNAAADGL